MRGRGRSFASLLAALGAAFVAATAAGCAPCLEFGLKDDRVISPAGLLVSFELATCGDRDPVPDIKREEWSIYEDGEPISIYESEPYPLPDPAGFAVFTALVVDMSGSITQSPGTLEALQSAAKELVTELTPDPSSEALSGPEVALYAFDGREAVVELQPFTTHTADLKRAIDGLSDFEIVDDSTDLNGAIRSGLDALELHGEGVDANLRIGSLVVFTDGADRANRVSDEAAQNAVAKSEFYTYTIGLGDEVDRAHLGAVGKDGAVFADDTDEIAESFEETAQRIWDRSRSHYVIAYCSPSRAGSHTLFISVLEHSGGLEVPFDANDFGPGCDARDIAERYEAGELEDEDEGDDDDDDDDDDA